VTFDDRPTFGHGERVMAIFAAPMNSCLVSCKRSWATRDAFVAEPRI